MMLIPCPHCGPRPETEFVYGGDANVKRPDPAAPDAEWTDYIYFRDNPKARIGSFGSMLPGATAG